MSVALDVFNQPTAPPLPRELHDIERWRDATSPGAWTAKRSHFLDFTNVGPDAPDALDLPTGEHVQLTLGGFQAVTDRGYENDEAGSSSIVITNIGLRYVFIEFEYVGQQYVGGGNPSLGIDKGKTFITHLKPDPNTRDLTPNLLNPTLDFFIVSGDGFGRYIVETAEPVNEIRIKSIPQYEFIVHQIWVAPIPAVFGGVIYNVYRDAPGGDVLLVVNENDGFDIRPDTTGLVLEPDADSAQAFLAPTDQDAGQLGDNLPLPQLPAGRIAGEFAIGADGQLKEVIDEFVHFERGRLVIAASAWGVAPQALYNELNHSGGILTASFFAPNNGPTSLGGRYVGVWMVAVSSGNTFYITALDAPGILTTQNNNVQSNIDYSDNTTISCRLALDGVLSAGNPNSLEFWCGGGNVTIGNVTVTYEYKHFIPA